jgi:hypothetical protein
MSLTQRLSSMNDNEGLRLAEQPERSLASLRVEQEAWEAVQGIDAVTRRRSQQILASLEGLSRHAQQPTGFENAPHASSPPTATIDRAALWTADAALLTWQEQQEIAPLARRRSQALLGLSEAAAESDAVLPSLKEQQEWNRAHRPGAPA